ncbi:acyltransferase family protein [Macrococcoides canis]|uniref:acyltransferase family protein n=1 Tax=Macrococcoides canis TaxID=1855823 RepID=UPI0020B753EB|nr:acyltransferase family protein [Macrococcus canis]UTH12354.1 acyltransferase [Macrococcus canis]
MNNLNERFLLERRFRPEIEGLRIVAALLVAIYHIWLNRVSGGVDVFFVISGYLITTSIISKIKKDGYLSPIKYFGGLLKRLLPGALTVIGASSLLSIFLLPSSILLKYIKETIASLLYYQNLQLAFSKTDYLDKEQMKTPLEHFWAMSIQGQFYIIWFILFVFIVYLLNKYEWINPVKLITFIFTVILIISLVFSIYQTATNQQFAYFNPLARVWQFALGGLMCLHLNKIKITPKISDILGWFGLIGLIITGILFDVGNAFPGIASLWPMFCAILILLSGNVPSKYGVERILSSKPFVFLGGISFGIYLWHWVILSFYKYKVTSSINFIDGVAIILLSIGLSVFMTYYIEKPIRTKVAEPKRKIKNLYRLNVALLIILVMSFSVNWYQDNKINKMVLTGDTKSLNKMFPGALSIGHDYKLRPPLISESNIAMDKSDAYEDGIMVPENSEVLIKEYGNIKDYERNILLVGGSHSSQWLGALQEIAKDEKIKITHIGKPGARFSLEYQKPYINDWMKNVNEYIHENNQEIDMIFTQANVSEEGYSSMPVGFKEQFKYLEQYNIKIFAVKDNPRLGFGTNPIEMYERDKNWTKDVTDLNIKDWKDESLKNVVYYDYNDFIVPNNTFTPIIGNIFVYFDSEHISDSYMRTLAPIIKEDVLRELNLEQE